MQYLPQNDFVELPLVHFLAKLSLIDNLPPLVFYFNKKKTYERYGYKNKIFISYVWFNDNLIANAIDSSSSFYNAKKNKKDFSISIHLER